MKKALYILFAFAAVAVAVTGCSKKSGGGGTNAYAPNSCFQSNGVSQFGGRYQPINGQCVDTQTGQIANQANCSYNPNQNYNCNYGGNYFYGQGSLQDAIYRCSLLNNGYRVYYPILMPQGYMCAEYATFSAMWSYGTPAFYPGSTQAYQGCVPGYSNCNCRSFGGTMGYIQWGVCF